MTNGTPHTASRPWSFWLVGSILLGAVPLVLATAFLRDRQVRAPIGTQTTSHRAQR